MPQKPEKCLKSQQFKPAALKCTLLNDNDSKQASIIVLEISTALTVGINLAAFIKSKFRAL